MEIPSESSAVGLKERTWKFDPDLGCCADGESCFCCWDDCCEQLVSLKELENHLESHVSRRLLSGHVSCLVTGCNFEAPDKERLIWHVRFHCYHARLQSKGLEQIQKLWEKNSNEQSITHCNHLSVDCNKIFYSGDALPCCWEGCERVVNNAVEFFRHVVGHVEIMDTSDRTADKTYLCKWNGCSGSFRRLNYLKEHMKHHSGEKMYACPFCGSFICNATKMTDHIMRKLSTPTSRLKCFCCQKTFSTQRLLKEHMRRHVKKLKCEFCPMTCETPSDLRYHHRIRHKTQKDFICAICSKAYSRLALLRTHLNKHEESTMYKCDQCTKEFKWKGALVAHIRLKHLNKDVNSYLCHICPKRYSRGAILSKHLRKEHLIKIPPGFAKFSYKKCEDGFFRLQTERYESVELAAELQGCDESRREQEASQIISQLAEEDEKHRQMASTPLLAEPNIPADLRNISAVNPPSEGGILAPLEIQLTVKDQFGNPMKIDGLSDLTFLVNGKEMRVA